MRCDHSVPYHKMPKRLTGRMCVVKPSTPGTEFQARRTFNEQMGDKMKGYAISPEASIFYANTVAMWAQRLHPEVLSSKNTTLNVKPNPVRSSAGRLV